MKIYVSGKITGMDRLKAAEKFCKAETELMRRGYTVINPLMVNMALPKATTHEEYMAMSLLMLSMCDTIYMLDNWKDSPGAREEYDYAIKNDYTIMFEGDAPIKE